MSEVAAFPALARAKGLYLQRKHAAKQHEEVRVDSTSIRRSCPINRTKDQERQKQVNPAGSKAASRYTSSLIAFCSDFDKQLRLINSDLMVLHTSVRREYQRESLAQEKLTSKLLEREVNNVGIHPADQRDVKHCRVRLRARKPCIKLQVVLQSPLKVSTPKKPPPSPKILSRVALLAHQTVKACVLQRYTRLYLYRYLFHGGPRQLVAAIQLSTRCRRSRAFRQWRRVVTQRLKLRLRCRRAQQRIEQSITSWSLERAVEIVETEGKYAMAKEFHQSKLVARSFHTWLGWYQSFAVPGPI